MILSNLSKPGRALAAGLCSFAFAGLLLPAVASAAALEEAPPHEQVLPPEAGTASQAHPQSESSAKMRAAPGSQHASSQRHGKHGKAAHGTHRRSKD